MMMGINQSMFVFLSEGAPRFSALRPLDLIELLCVFACGITIEDTTQTSMWYYTQYAQQQVRVQRSYLLPDSAPR
jgi:hypothetical protein